MTEKKYHNKNKPNAQVKNDLEIYLAKHIHFDSIDSTNTWAKTHTDQWSLTGVTLVTASEQTAGRGRFKRQWISPPHQNIYATFCIWLNVQRTDCGFIPQILALSAAQILEKQGFLSAIKWPNDLLLKSKKVAGILCETVVEGELRGVICGIGLNVNMTSEILNQIDRPATSLLIEGGNPLDVGVILELLQKQFLINLKEFVCKGFSSFFPLLQERSFLTKGQKVRFHDNQNLIEAQFEYLHSDGSVELRLPNGQSKIFYSGEFLY